MQNGLVAALLAASAFLLCQVAVASDKVWRRWHVTLLAQLEIPHDWLFLLQYSDVFLLSAHFRHGLTQNRVTL
jgi:hypothetical protein